MDGTFGYSSFFESKRVVTLGELKNYFGFLYLNDISTIVDDVLAFEGTDKGIVSLKSKISLTPKRVENILKGIQKWQSNNAKSITQRNNKNSSFGERIILPNVKEEVSIPTGYLSVKSAKNKYGISRSLSYILERPNATRVMYGESYIYEQSLIEFINKVSDRIKKRSRRNPPESVRKIKPHDMD